MEHKELDSLVNMIEDIKSEEQLMELRSLVQLRLSNLTKHNRGLNLIQEKERELEALKNGLKQGADISFDYYAANDIKDYLSSQTISAEQVEAMKSKEQ